MPAFGQNLADERAAAKEEIVAWLNTQGEIASGRIPNPEQATWDAKEAAAKRIQAGIQTTEDTSLISIESALVGETLAVTVDKVAANAAAFRITGPLITGIRRRVDRALAAATNVEQIQTIILKNKELFNKAMADSVNFAADPQAWMSTHSPS